jgi:alkaline phosphatase D
MIEEEEVLPVEDILLGKDIPDKKVEETTGAVDPTDTVTSVADTSSYGVLEPEIETNTIPLPTSVVNDTVPEVIELAPEPEPPAPAEFMIFLGDFVYADVPIWWGDDQEAYQRLYRRTYQSPSFRKVYERLRELIQFLS